MSGTEAAATLSLEIDTHPALASLEALEAKLLTFRESLPGKMGKFNLNLSLSTTDANKQLAAFLGQKREIGVKVNVDLASAKSQLASLAKDVGGKTLAAPTINTSALEESIKSLTGSMSGMTSSLRESLATVATYNRTVEDTARRASESNKGLAESHNKSATAAKAHADATNKFTLSGNDAHAMARGLSGTLGTLWMTYGAIVPLMAGAALGAGFKEAAKSGSEFAYQLTFVKALGGESAEAVKNLADQAKTLAKDGLYGPNEIASGYRILAQAGLDATQALAAMPSVLNLATVGEMSMEQAGVALVGVMNAFNLSVKDSGHISDVFAKAAAVSQTSVSQMTEAMRAASVVGEQYGASMEDTATAVTLLAKVNITGTAAGTSLRNMLKEIYSPGKQAADTLKMLGVSAQDATGGIRPFADVIYDLKDKLEQFDKASQIKLEQKLFGERGAKEFVQMVSMSRDEWDKFKTSIADSDGFSVGVAQQLEDTVQGKWKQALNTMKVSLLNTYEELAPVFGQLADSLKNLFSSSEFTTGTKAFVTSMVTVSSFLVEHGATVLKVAEAYLALKAATLAASVALAGINGVVKVTEMLAGLSAATSAAGAGISLFSGTLGAVARGAATTVTGLTGVAGVLSLLSTPITIIAGLLTGGAVLWALWGSKASEAADQAKTRVDALKGSIENINSLFENLKYAGVGNADSFLAASNRALAEQSKAYDTIQSTINASGLKFLETPADRNRKLTFDYGSGDITDENGKKYATSMLKNSKVLDELIAKFKATGVAAKEAKAQADQMFKEADERAVESAKQAERKLAGTKKFDGEKPDKAAASDTYRADIEALKGYIASYKAEYSQFVSETAKMRAEGSISEIQMLTANWADKNALLEAEMGKQREIIARAEKEKNKSADVAAAKNDMAALLAAQERALTDYETAVIKSKAKTNDEILKLEVSLSGKLETERDKAITVMQGQYAKLLQEALNNGDVDLIEKLGKIKEAYLKAADIKDAANSINSGLSSISMGLSALGSDVDKLEADMERDGGWISRIMNTSEITTLINERLPALREEIARLEAEMANMPEGSEESREYLKIQKDLAKARKEADKFGNYVPKVWKDTVSKIDSTFHDGFVAIFSKGKTDWNEFGRSLAASFKTTVMDAIYQMIARPLVMKVVVSVAGTMGVNDLASAAESQGSMGSLGSIASLGNNTYSLFSGGGTASSLATDFALSGAGSALGLSTGLSTSLGVASGAGTTMGASAALAASEATAAGAAGLTAAGSTALAAIPYVGWAIAAIAAISSMMGKGGGPKTEGDAYGTLSGSTLSLAATDRTGDNWITGTNSNAVVESLLTPIGTSVAGLIKSMGGSANGLSFNLGFSTDTKGTAKDNIQSGVMDAAGNYVYRNGRNAERGSYSTELQLEAQRMMVAAVKAADVSQVYKDIAGSVDLYTASAEELQTVLSNLSAVTSLRTAFDTLGFGADKLSMALITAAGGTSTLATNLDSYYQNFYSETERNANTLKQISAAMGDLGLTMPTTREGFRALVDAQDLTTDAGQKTFAALMGLNGAFASVVPAATAASTAISETMKSLQAKTADLQVELLKAQGKTAEATAAQRAIDTVGMNAAEVAVYDYNAALRKQIDALNAANEAAKAAADTMTSLQAETKSLQVELLTAQGRIADATAAQRAIDTAGMNDAAVAVYDYNASLRAQISILTERTGLQDQLDDLTMTSAQLLAKQRAALDASNRGLFDQVNSLKALATAAAEAATRMSSAAGTFKSTFATDASRAADLRSSLYSLGLGMPESESAFIEAVNKFAVSAYSKDHAIAFALQAAADKYAEDVKAGAESADKDLSERLTNALRGTDLTLPKTLSELDTLIAGLKIDGNGPNAKKLAELQNLSPAVAAYFAALKSQSDASAKANEEAMAALQAAIKTAQDSQRSISYLGVDQTEVAKREAARLTKAFNDAFVVDAPTTLAAAQKMAASLDPTVSMNQALLASLADLAAALNTVESAAREAAKQAEAEAEAKRKAIADERANLESQLLTAQGDTAAIRAKELAALDASNRALKQQIWAIEDQKTALESLKTNADTAYAALERAITAQKKIAQASVDAAQEQVTSLKGIFDNLKSNVATLYGDVDSTKSMGAADGQSFIANALATALSSGYMPDPEDLADAVAAAIGGTTDAVYASQVDADRAKLVLAGQMDSLKKVSGKQLSTAELALKAAEEQLKSLDATLEEQRKLLDAAKGIDTSVLSVADAIKMLATSLSALKAQTQNPGANTSTSASNSGFSQAATPVTGSYTTSAWGTGGDALVRLSGGVSFIDSASWSAANEANYLKGLAANYASNAETVASITAYAKANKIPGFAVGANVIPQDMVAQLHKDEAIIPAPFNPWAGGKLPANNTERLELLVEKLTEEVNMLRYEARATATNTNKTAKALEKFDVDGMPAERVAA